MGLRSQFDALLASGRRSGFIALVRPLTFEERVEEQRRIRDLEYSPPDEDLARAFLVVQAPATLEQIKTEAFSAALRATGGNVSAAARILGVHRRTLYRNVAA